MFNNSFAILVYLLLLQYIGPVFLNVACIFTPLDHSAMFKGCGALTFNRTVAACFGFILLEP